MTNKLEGLHRFLLTRWTTENGEQVPLVHAVNELIKDVNDLEGSEKGEYLRRLQAVSEGAVLADGRIDRINGQVDDVEDDIEDLTQRMTNVETKIAFCKALLGVEIE